MMCPFLSKTKPDPTPLTPSCDSFLCTLIRKTPGSDFSKISINDNFVEYVVFSIVFCSFSLTMICVLSIISFCFIDSGGATNNTTTIITTAAAPIILPTAIPELSMRFFYFNFLSKRIPIR